VDIQPEKMLANFQFSSRALIVIGLIVFAVLYIGYFSNQALHYHGWERDMAKKVGDYEKYFSPELTLYMTVTYMLLMALLNVFRFSKALTDAVLSFLGIILIVAFALVNWLTLLYSYNTNNAHAVEKGWLAFLIPLAMTFLRMLPAFWKRWDKHVDRWLERINQK
jgi:hypothetical protein